MEVSAIALSFLCLPMGYPRDIGIDQEVLNFQEKEILNISEVHKAHSFLLEIPMPAKLKKLTPEEHSTLTTAAVFPELPSPMDKCYVAVRDLNDNNQWQALRNDEMDFEEIKPKPALEIGVNLSF